MMNKCNLFYNNPSFFVSPYWVQSPVSLFLCLSVSLSLSIGREFICTLDGNAIKIKNPNFIELEQFCDDFGFTELGVKLSDFRPSISFKEGAAASEAKQKQK
jgi:hypothetical protein